MGAAYALGLLSSRLGLPPLVGYLTAGFLLAAFGVGSSDFLEHIADIGVLLLLFTVGLKLRVGSLLRPEVIGVGGVHLLLFGSLIGGALLVSLGPQAAVYVGLGLAFSSTVLAIKQLEDKRELGTFHGRVAIGILILQDLVAVALLAAAGVKTPSPWALVFVALFILRPVIFRILSRSGHDELLLLFGLGLALAGGSLAQAVGISPELGALLMGALLAGHSQTTELSRTLWGLKEAFLVAFFLTIGLGGLPTLDSVGLAMLFLLALPLKTVAFFGLFIWFGLRARTAFVASLSLGSYSEFALITAAPLVASGGLDPAWETMLALTVAASLALAAPINRASHLLYERYERTLSRFERPGRHPDREPTRLGSARWLVVGMGRTGGGVYKRLEASGERVVGLDADPTKLERHRAKGRRVLYGDAEDPELWERLEFGNLKGVFLTMPDLEAKIRATNGLRQRHFSGFISASSYHLEEDALLQKAGVNLIIHPFGEAGERMAERTLTELAPATPEV